MTLMQVGLDDKYRLDAKRIYLSGIQALVRLPMLQRERDRAQNLNTGGFISGYRGSPLGMYDNALVAGKVVPAIAQYPLRHPGLNEDLAATAVWGSQQVGLFPGAKVDGVFGIWYGKGPGVDRSGDVLKHANAAGTARHGGVLALAGDDHGANPRRLAHQSEQIFAAAMMPILNPATLQDYLDFGLLRLCVVALLRLLGRLQGDRPRRSRARPRSQSIRARLRSSLPADFAMPPGGLNIRWPDPPLEQERRLHGPKMAAVAAFARANQLDRVVIDAARARLGIVTTGKAYLDVRQALADLGIDAKATPRQLGIRLYKVGTDLAARGRGRARSPRACRTSWWSRKSAASSKTSSSSCSTTWRRSARASSASATRHGARAAAERRRAHADQVRAAIVARLRGLVARESGAGTAPGAARSLRTAGRDAAAAMARSARPISAPAARTTPRPMCRKAAARMAGIGCHGMAIAVPSRRTATISHMGGEGVDLDRPGALHQRTPHLPEHRRRHLFPIPACWRSAPPPPPASTSPTRFSTTTRSR